ncbi:polysaccharide deacetylase family protein [Novosphingobium sp.]|uniref:polysaccharide deacetylase family protein n=1 Tax=Novosphingobium sp. TaxID=1874826 RepID=UPI0038BB4458
MIRNRRKSGVGPRRAQKLCAALALLAALAVAPAMARPAASAHAARAGTIALTFDDLPGLTLSTDQTWVDAINRDLIAAIARNRLPVIGFVNQGKVEDLDRPRQIANLRRWVQAGIPLGNHTYSHESPNDLGAAGYIADIAHGEPVIRAVLGPVHQRLRWFRHPYLETGSPAGVKARINRWLAAHGYRIAPVTIDADDWEFAEPYDDAARRGDSAERTRIRQSYLAYTARTIAWYRKAARALFGRDIAYVMLLHDSRLNADSLDDLVGILRHERLKPVSLETAMRDPAYRTADHYVGRDGVEWLERWSDTLHRELPWDDFTDVPDAIRKAYQKVDPDRP